MIQFDPAYFANYFRFTSERLWGEIRRRGTGASRRWLRGRLAIFVRV
jgi:hypothetical protein